MATDILGTLTGLASNPIGLAISILLSTLIGGIVLLVLVEVIGKKFSEKINPINAFLAMLVINLINLLGILGFLTPYIAGIPFSYIIVIILPAVIWIVLMKVFFHDMKIMHAVLVGIIGYFLSIFVIPMIVGMAMVYFIPVTGA
jgi:hypothetical protein